ncbi:peptidase [Azoarcus olearius]|uniref:C39 family peptidase n=1 Tax=Azoarcus sp. (strain BH72) TaxID=418699 RepID=UPI0008062997|nr:C39 family peptidase [Azoarcus olearius]ANQ86191.1 peptidase [Azoarcus olearius]
MAQTRPAQCGRLRRAAAALACAGAATALAADLRMVAPLGGSLSVPTVSLREARFVTTLRQQYDFSCGSAAVATLLTHHYGHPVNEAQVFQVMYASGDQAKIRREGFSMLDMKRYLDQLGFITEGVEATLDQLAAVGVPAIALIQEHGYAHFVVVKGLRNASVLLGDPAMGTRVVSRTDFERNWRSGILLVVNNNVDRARFNQEVDWRVRPRAPLARGLDNNTADVQLLQRAPSDH